MVRTLAKLDILTLMADPNMGSLILTGVIWQVNLIKPDLSTPSDI